MQRSPRIVGFPLVRIADAQDGAAKPRMSRKVETARRTETPSTISTGARNRNRRPTMKRYPANADKAKIRFECRRSMHGCNEA